MTWFYSVVLGEGQDPLSEVDEPMQNRAEWEHKMFPPKQKYKVCTVTERWLYRRRPDCDPHYRLVTGFWILTSCTANHLFYSISNPNMTWDFIATHNEVFVKKELVAVKSLEGVWVDGQSLPHAPLKRGPSRKREDPQVIPLALTLTMLTHWTGDLKTKILRLNH